MDVASAQGMFKHLLPLILFAVTANAQLDPYAFGNYAVYQTSTSDSEVHLNAILPRLKDYTMRARPILENGAFGDWIDSALLRVEQDPDKRLHDKVMRFQFKGLSPQVKYHLEIWEKSKYGTKMVEQRYFHTMDPKPRKMNVGVFSCMCDEQEYRRPRTLLWPMAEAQKFDALFLLGDMTYVDSVNSVPRDNVTAHDVWQRTVDSAKTLPLGRFQTLVPIAVTWDDHDAGVDNANKDFAMVKEALRATSAIYSGDSIPGTVENGEGGLQKYVKWAGAHYFLLDNRSFRTSHKDDHPYGHFGESQETWLFNHLKNIGNSGPVFLMNGDMWGSPTIQKPGAEGKPPRRLTESFFGDHPTNYNSFMNKLNALNVNYTLFSGDIHFSQIIEHGPEAMGSSRYAPFQTYEITSSPMSSIIFKPTGSEPEFWADAQRVVAYRDYNFVSFQYEWLDAKKALKFEARSHGEVNGEAKTFFQFGATVTRDPEYKAVRRRLLEKGFERKDKKVKVAFFDADATLRIAPSKSVTAQNPNDVYILPGAANKIAELNRQGYLIAIVSNQGGVHAGYNTFADAEGALITTIRKIREQNKEAKIHYFDMADQAEGDYFRKPNIGMGKNLERVLARKGYTLDWANSMMIGDAQYKKTDTDPRTGKPGRDFTNTDRLFAENLGIKTFHPFEYFGWTQDILEAVYKTDAVEVEKLSPTPPVQTLLCRKAVAQ